MRNRQKTRMWRSTLAATLFGIAAGVGCVPPEAGTGGPGGAAKTSLDASGKPLKPGEIRPTLDGGYAAFQRKQLDEAMTAAERVLIGNPMGTGAAEAQYLRGRVLEERATASAAKGDVTAAKSQLQTARDAYNAGLAARPATSVEGNLRAGVANVAYFQEDYATAIAQWKVAYERIAEPATKSWVLYRIGLSHQRYGNFPEADKTFSAVQKEFPGTEPARRAAAHQGARGFHIQVGVFGTPANADGAVTDLRSQGVIGMIVADPNGRQIVRVGPVSTYDQAKALKTRLAGKYPDAVIIP